MRAGCLAKTEGFAVAQTVPAFLDPKTSLLLFPELGETERQRPVNLSRLSGADSCAFPLQQAVSSLSGVILVLHTTGHTFSPSLQAPLPCQSKTWRLLGDLREDAEAGAKAGHAQLLLAAPTAALLVGGDVLPLRGCTSMLCHQH